MKPIGDLIKYRMISQAIERNQLAQLFSFRGSEENETEDSLEWKKEYISKK